MINKKSIVYLALFLSVSIFISLTMGSEQYNTHVNNVGISVTIIGFGITLYLLKEVVDLSTVNKELKEREIFKDKILHNLARSLEELKGYTDDILNNNTSDRLAERQRITGNIISIYKSDYIKQMKKVSNASPGFSSFDKRYTEFYNHLKKSVFVTKNQTPSKNVVETINGLTGAFLLDVKTYIEVMQDNN